MTNEAPATKAALAYFERVRARDPDGIAALCADDAQVLLHDGRAFRGRAGIRDAYAQIFAHNDPQPQVISTISEGAACAAEITGSRPDGTTGHVLDVFRVDAAGLVQEVRVYIRNA